MCPIRTRFLFYLPAELHHDADDLDGDSFDLGSGVGSRRISWVDGVQFYAATIAQEYLLECGLVSVDQDGAVIAAVAGGLLTKDDSVTLQVLGIHTVPLDAQAEILPLSIRPGGGNLFPIQHVFNGLDGDAGRDGAQHWDADSV